MKIFRKKKMEARVKYRERAFHVARDSICFFLGGYLLFFASREKKNVSEWVNRTCVQ